MLPHVKILYRTICAQAEWPMVLARTQADIEHLRDEVVLLMTSLKLPFSRRTRMTIDTAEWRMTFVCHPDLDQLCGVRADIMFARLSEWSEEEVNTLLRPCLAGSMNLRRYKVERSLIKQGLLLATERQPYPHGDDLLINLD